MLNAPKPAFHVPFKIDAVNQNTKQNFAEAELGKDGAFYLLSSQIFENYTHIVRKHVLPYLQLRDGLGLRELRIINCLFKHDYGLQAAEVARIMCIDPATVSRAGSILMKKAMLTKEPCTEDARSAVLVLTNKGREVAEEYVNVSSRVFEFLAGLVNVDVSEEYFERILRASHIIRDRTTRMEKVHPRYVERYLSAQQRTD